jgi:hypothetical protein
MPANCPSIAYTFGCGCGIPIILAVRSQTWPVKVLALLRKPRAHRFTSFATPEAVAIGESKSMARPSAAIPQTPARTWANGCSTFGPFQIDERL